MRKEADLMLGKKAAPIGAQPPGAFRDPSAAGSYAGDQIAASEVTPVAGTEGAVRGVPGESTRGPGLGLMGAIPLAALMMYAGNRTKGMGGKAWNRMGAFFSKNPKHVKGFSDYMAKAQAPVGSAAGFRTPKERLDALDAIFAEIGKNPKAVKPQVLAMLNSERTAVQSLADQAGQGGNPLFRMWEQHGPKTLPGMLATVGAGGVALNAGDIASNAFGGGGGKRRGAPVIING